VALVDVPHVCSERLHVRPRRRPLGPLAMDG
jgi:hypothetical protein